MPRPCDLKRRVFLFLALLLFSATMAACGGNGGPASSPTETEPLRTPPSITPSPPPPESAYRLVWREAGAKEDVIWKTMPSNAGQREAIARVPHREGTNIVASLSPDQRLLAYLTLPEGAADTDISQAEAHILDLALKTDTVIGGNMDFKFRPFWSPDGQLLFMRRYAGSEILAADVILIETRVARAPLPGEPPPTPAATAAPGATPPPPEDPLKPVLKAKYSQVLAFIPVAYGPDDRSLYFVQSSGGTQEGAILGQLTPATAAAIDQAQADWQAQVKAILDAYPTPDPNATPPPPDAPPTPAPPTLPPSPAPSTKMVLQLTDQMGEDYELSPDKTKLSFVVSGILEGGFVNEAMVADLTTSAVTPAPSAGLWTGDRVSPVWHPDGRLTLGLLPHAGPAGSAVLMPLGGGPPQFLHSPAKGFDAPRAWSPDGLYLAVTEYTGDSIANPGEASLAVVAIGGQRVEITKGEANSSEIAILGWFK